MKKKRSVDKATGHAKPIQAITLSDEKQNKLPIEPNLSPDRIMAGASTTTALLNQILAQQEEFHELRHWGINE
ncbi:MAG: hypothetical protein ABSD29_19675 [Verrucomicrobiota bacterium]|jgi:hypothetical protein